MEIVGLERKDIDLIATLVAAFRVSLKNHIGIH